MSRPKNCLDGAFEALKVSRSGSGSAVKAAKVVSQSFRNTVKHTGLTAWRTIRGKNSQPCTFTSKLNQRYRKIMLEDQDQPNNVVFTICDVVIKEIKELLGGKEAATNNKVIASLRPISEFVDLNRFSKPASFGEVQARVIHNVGHFFSNYAVVFLLLSIHSLLANKFLLFIMIFVVGGMYGIGKLDGRDLTIGTLKATSTQLYTGIIGIAVLLGLFSSLLTTILWLIGASGVSILGHASYMDKPINKGFSRTGPRARILI